MTGTPEVSAADGFFKTPLSRGALGLVPSQYSATVVEMELLVVEFLIDLVTGFFETLCRLMDGFLKFPLDFFSHLLFL